MRVDVIVNPASTRGYKTFKKLRHMLPHDWDVNYTFTRYPMHAVELASSVTSQMLIVCGGDGTLNEVINGCVQNPSPPYIAPVSAGNGSDIARSLGLRRDLESRLKEIEENLSKGGMAVRLSRVRTRESERYFIGVSDVGFGALVASRFNSFRLLGKAAYVIATFRSLPDLKPRVFRMVIDGSRLSVEAYMVVFARSQFFGGGMKVSPNSDLFSDKAKVIVLRSGRLHRFFLGMYKVYSGRHLELEEVEELDLDRSLVVESEGIPVECDGEFAGYSPAEYTITDYMVNFV